MDRSTFNAIVKEEAAKKREKYETALKNVKILHSMSAYERSQIADAIKTETHGEGEVIIQEGDSGDTFYMIMEGSASAFKQVDGEEKEVLKYNEGDYFGERALIKNEPRAATVKSTNASTKVMVLDRKSFKRMCGPIDEILMRNMENYNNYA